MLPRILLCAVVGFFTSSSLLMAQAKPSKKTGRTSSARQIHNSALIIDTHADTTQRLLDENFDMANPPAGDKGNLDFSKAKAGNLGAEFFSIWVEPTQFKGQYAHRTLDLIDAVYQQAAKHTDKKVMVFTTTGFVLAHRDPAAKEVQELSSLHIDETHPVARQVASGAHGGLLTLQRGLNEKGVLRNFITVDDTRRTIEFFGSTAAVDGGSVCVVETV